MVKSKITTDVYIHSLLFLVFFTLFLFLLSVVILRGYFDNDVIFMLILESLLVLLMGQYALKAFNRIEISKEERRIVISNKLFFSRKTIHFDDLQGYVTGRLKRKRIAYKVIWLVQDDVMRYKIDEMFIKNINELESEIKDLKYFGYQLFTFRKRFSMLFKQQKFEE